MDINEAMEILQRNYAKSWSIAKAWDILQDKKIALDDEHYRRIELKHQFIEKLKLPLYYESVNDGFYPANEIPTGASVKDIEYRNSLCISVKDVYVAAIKANLSWPISPPNEMGKWPSGELTSPTEALAFTNMIIHRRLKKSHYMDSPIKQARAIASNPNDVSEIWALLLRSAESPTPWPPIIEVAGDLKSILCYDKSFSKGALRKYLERNPQTK